MTVDDNNNSELPVSTVPPPSSLDTTSKPASSSARFPIVGIGASAGGLQAMEQLLARLQRSGQAFLIVQHFPAHERSTLQHLLARVCALPVLTMTDGLPILADTVYVSAPGTLVEVRDGRMVVRANDGDGHATFPIDVLFRSLAMDRGALAVAVVLSGAGSDGALGVRAVKEAGGVVFAQLPSSAEQQGMPQAVLDSNTADFCLAPDAIGEELMRLGSLHESLPTGPRHFDAEAMSALFELLQRASGVDFSSYKPSTVQRRLDRRMTMLRIESAQAYLALLREKRGELNALYSDLLISVTGFFRDREPFEELPRTVLPVLLESRKPDLPIRVWVPGCATGEEAYSLVICLLEYIEEHCPGQRIQVFATDIDDRALAKARHGVYASNIESDVSRERLQRFFVLTDKGYQVSRKVRDLVVFARHNLGKDPPFSRIDLVSCRNVLIYLQPALQKRVMRVFHYALSSRGFLLLGTAESVGDAPELFSLMDRKLKLYVKKTGTSPGVFDFAFGQRRSDGGGPVNEPPSDRKPEPNLHQLADRKILDKYGPPGVLVDEQLNILQFRGQTGPFLGPSPGAATLNILRMIRPELLVALKGALQRALQENKQVTCEATRLSDGRAYVAMDIIPLDASAHPRCLLVLFREVTLPTTPADAAAAGSAEGDAGNDPRLQLLERELVSTKEYLETIIQELATSNEELQSSNEELQSSNEELQSTNEELETSKEELQSSNEELVTVNEELQARILELGIAKDDLLNVLGHVGSPILLIGLDLRIRRFSAVAERLLNLVPADIGRPVSYLSTTLNVPQVEASVNESIQSMRFTELRVRCANGAWYNMRTVPYQALDHSIRGAVIELSPLVMNPAPGQPAELDELAGKVLATLPNELVVLDQSMRVVWANQSFLETFGAGLDLFGEPLENLVPRGPASQTLWASIEEAAFTGKSFDGLPIEQNWGNHGVVKLRWSARCLPASSQRGALTMLAIERAE